MTIRFAPSRNRGIFAAVVTTGQGNALARRPVNDNGLVAANDDALFKQTLRHFAEHGLSAAERARAKAIDARRAGDEDGYEWWLSVCRKLDRRMADKVPASTEAPPAAADSLPLS